MQDVVTKIITLPLSVQAAKGGNGLVRGTLYQIVAVTWRGEVVVTLPGATEPIGGAQGIHHKMEKFDHVSQT